MKKIILLLALCFTANNFFAQTTDPNQLKNEGNDALNALKKARIEGWTDATYDQEALLNEIMNERERELVGEGYRLMDLKRWGKGVKRGKPQSKGLVLFPGQASTDGLDKPVDDQRMLWPIPKTEMDANPQLAGQQNPGY